MDIETRMHEVEREIISRLPNTPWILPWTG